MSLITPISGIYKALGSMSVHPCIPAERLCIKGVFAIRWQINALGGNCHVKMQLIGGGSFLKVGGLNFMHELHVRSNMQQVAI